MSNFINETPVSLEKLLFTLSEINNAIRSCKLDNLKAIVENNHLGKDEAHLITGHFFSSLGAKVDLASRCFLHDFKEIMQYFFKNYHINFKDDDLIRIKTIHIDPLLDVLKEASSYPEESSPLSVQQAAFYTDSVKLASYFLNIGRKVGAISFRSLLQEENNNYNSQRLNHFEWLLNKGGYIHDDFLYQTICYKQYYSKGFFISPGFSHKVVEILLNFNLTTTNEIEEIFLNCNIIKDLDEGNYKNGNKTFYPDLSDGLTVNNLKYLLAHQIPIDSLYAARVLINANDSKDVIEHIINQLEPIKRDLYHYNNYTISLIKNNPDTCANNKIITNFLGITTDQRIDWSACEEA